MEFDAADFGVTAAIVDKAAITGPATFDAAGFGVAAAIADKAATTGPATFDAAGFGVAAADGRAKRSVTVSAMSKTFDEGTKLEAIVDDGTSA